MFVSPYEVTQERRDIEARWRATDGDDAFLREAYRRMKFIRAFEERCLALTAGPSPAILGSVHLCAGQEAIPVGALAALGSDDRLVATYRGHGWALEAGVPADRFLAEFCHRAQGVNGGRAGSPYLMAPAYGLVGENSIVGAGGPIACGVAMALQAAGRGQVALVSFGDGATSQGAIHEAMVFAAARNLPIIFLCENNGWSELTATSDIVKVRRLAERARGYGMQGATIDGGDPRIVRDVLREAVKKARDGGGPSMIECRTVRLWGHYNADVEHYRPKEDRAAAAAADPVARLRARLLAEGHAAEADLAAEDRDIEERLDAMVEWVRALPPPDAATARDHVLGPLPPPRAATAAEPAGEEMTYAAAVNRALRDELASRPEVLVYGEDVGKSGGVFGVSRDLQRTFGESRVFDTPIAESAILGSAVGAAFEGMRPIVEIMWSDFLLVALDQIVNQASNVRYVTQSDRTVPMVVRTQQGATPGSCAQHSQCLEALLVHVPGLIVGMPSTPNDAYHMLRAAAANPDPCIIIECRALYRERGPVDLAAPAEPIGAARVRKEGGDLAILTWGRITHVVMQAAAALEKDGIRPTVLELRWLSPLDDAAIAAAVAACGGRVMIVHEANRTGGVGAEIAARIADRNFHLLTGPIRRIATPDMRMPASPHLQKALLPSVERIVEGAKNLIERLPAVSPA